MCGHNTQSENTFLIENDQIILNCVTIDIITVVHSLISDAEA